MSIINQMLKDIDQREKPQTGAKRPKSAYLGRPLRTRRLRLILWGCVLALLAFLAMSWLFERFTDSSSPARPSTEQLQIQRTPTVQVERTETSASNEQSAQETSSQVATQVPTQERESGDEPRSRATRGQQAQVVVTDLEPTRSPVQTEERPQEAQIPVQQVAPVVPEVNPAEESSEPAGEMTIQRSEGGTSSAERLHQRGMDALAAGQQRTALQRFREALLVNPDHVPSIEQLAALQFSRGFVGEALELLRDGLQGNPREMDLLLLKARIYERIEEPRAALDLLRNRQFRLPQDADLLILQGSIATELEEYALAIGAYRQLVNWRGDQGNWWIALGFSLERTEDPLNMQEAAEAYRRALQDRSLTESARNFALDRREALGY